MKISELNYLETVSENGEVYGGSDRTPTNNNENTNTNMNVAQSESNSSFEIDVLGDGILNGITL